MRQKKSAHAKVIELVERLGGMCMMVEEDADVLVAVFGSRAGSSEAHTSVIMRKFDSVKNSFQLKLNTIGNIAVCSLLRLDFLNSHTTIEQGASQDTRALAREPAETEGSSRKCSLRHAAGNSGTADRQAKPCWGQGRCKDSSGRTARGTQRSGGDDDAF